MKRKGTLSESMELTKDKTRYDAACKRLLSEKHILAWILQSSLDVYKDYGTREIAEHFIEGDPRVSDMSVIPDMTNMPSRIKGRSSEYASLYEGQSTFDLLFTAISPTRKQKRQILVDVEAQNKFYLGYPLINRAVFYGGRLLSSQYGRDFAGSDYSKIKGVCSIWICMHPPKRLQNHILEYRLDRKFRFGKPCHTPGSHDLFTIIMICLGDEDAAACTGVLRLLSILFLSDDTVDKKMKMLEEDFQIPMTMEMEKKVIDMCNFSDGIEQRGIEKGKKIGVREGRRLGLEQGQRKGKQEGLLQGKREGLRQGKQEGLLQGHEQALLYSIRNVMDSLSISAEQAMDILKVPTDRRSYFAELVQSGS